MSDNVASPRPTRVRHVAPGIPGTPVAPNTQTNSPRGSVTEGLTPAGEMGATPLHGKRLVLLEGLVAGLSINGASSRAGLSTRQTSRILADPSFREELRLAQAQIIEAAVARLSVSLDLGVSVLRGLAADQAVPPATRAQAAGKLIEFGIRTLEIEQVGARIAQLEQAFGLAYDV